MALDVDWDADVAACVTDLGGTMTWDSTDYACVIGAIGKGTSMDGPEGYFGDQDFMIVVQASLFSGSRPTAGEQVTVGGTAYRIVRVETDPADAALNLYIEEKTA